MKTLRATVGYSRVWTFGDKPGIIVYESGMMIDADGSPHAYAPLGSGLPALDYLANAGRVGNWWGVACIGVQTPKIQEQNDPAPGYYVSTTALMDPDYSVTDPRRYVDSEKVPFAVVPSYPRIAPLGSLGVALRPLYGKLTSIIVADIGPAEHLGEFSIACANALGVKSDAKHGGVSSGILTYLDTALVAKWRNGSDFASDAMSSFNKTGGISWLKGEFPEIDWE